MALNEPQSLPVNGLASVGRRGAEDAVRQERLAVAQVQVFGTVQPDWTLISHHGQACPTGVGDGKRGGIKDTEFPVKGLHHRATHYHHQLPVQMGIGPREAEELAEGIRWECGNTAH